MTDQSVDQQEEKCADDEVCACGDRRRDHDGPDMRGACGMNGHGVPRNEPYADCRAFRGMGRYDPLPPLPSFVAQTKEETITGSAIMCADGTGFASLPLPASHWDVAQSAIGIDEPLKQPQGFVTSTGRFVDRREARRIAVAAGQVRDVETYQPDVLFSEDFRAAQFRQTAPTPTREQKLIEALRAIEAMQPVSFDFPKDWREQIAACAECVRWKDHPIQQGICDSHRKPLYARERHNDNEEAALGSRMRGIATNALRDDCGAKLEGDDDRILAAWNRRTPSAAPVETDAREPERYTADEVSHAIFRVTGMGVGAQMIDERSWYYEECAGIEIANEVTDYNDEYLCTDTIKIPWRQLRASLARYDAKAKR